VDRAQELDWAQHAVQVVMADLRFPDGRPAPQIIVGEDDELIRQWIDLSPWAYPKASDVLGWVIGTDHSAVGIPRIYTEDWDDWLVTLADIIQEAVIEDSAFWGSACPPCPVHPNHPLNPAVREGTATWCCPKDQFSAPIGSLAAG
jgi:hypothetical protein